MMKPMASNGALRIGGLLVLWCLAVAAWAGDGAVRLGANPWISLADGRSNVWVTAQVTDHAGRNVPDGTQIVFQTNLGSFRESVVPTINGMARPRSTVWLGRA